MDELVEVHIGRLLTELGLTIALAESCTGGLIGHRLTNVAGSSRYFLGSAVTYAYSAKEHVLGVDHTTLLNKGAVSAEVAQQMAQGARRTYGADLALAVTGIAGPDGGTPDKPVGLTHIHLSAANVEWGERWVWHHDRVANKERSADAALALILRYLQERQANELAHGDAQPAVARAGWTQVAVDAWRTPDGQVHPRAFTWFGEMHVVVAEGRRWSETVNDTAWRCILVQTALGDTFELRRNTATDAWAVSGTWLRPRLA